LNNVHVVDYLSAGLEAFAFAEPEVRPFYQPYYPGRGGSGFDFGVGYSIITLKSLR
jgi:hypothetical protein